MWQRLFLIGLSLVLVGCGDDDLGAIITPVNEVHYQGGGQVDMLFVVDSSGSMGEEQAALADGFGAFIETFLELEYDFHLAVTDMDYEATAGALFGDPAILTPETPNLVEQFQENALLGTGGSGSEKGMEAARQALSEAKREGVNRGFFREESLLAVIFLTDEDDQSTASNETYLDFFLELKRGDRRRLKLSAIAGPVPDGCDTAMPGARYADVVAATGGVFVSICQDDVGMPRLGEVLSGYKSAFPLAHAPLDGVVSVSVDGVAIDPGPDTWQLDENNRVAFVQGAVPPDCAEVQLAYHTREPVQNGGEPIVVETDAPICATLDLPTLDLPPRSGCAQLSVDARFAFGALMLLLLARGRRRRRTILR